MDNNMNDLVNNIKNMMDNGNIPPEIQQIMNNIKNSNSNTNTTQTSSQNMDINKILNQKKNIQVLQLKIELI